MAAIFAQQLQSVFVLDGIALDCCSHARSQEGLSKAKGLQAPCGLAAALAAHRARQINNPALAQTAKAA